MGDLHELRRDSRVLLDDTLTVRAEPQAARRARHWVMSAVAGVGVGGASNQVVELLTAELVTNALQYGPSGGEVTVRVCVLVRGVGWVVRLVVHDEGDGMPQVQQPDPAEMRGRGLALVAALSSAWGATRTPEGGTTVWFEVEVDG